MFRILKLMLDGILELISIDNLLFQRQQPLNFELEVNMITSNMIGYNWWTYTLIKLKESNIIKISDARPAISTRPPTAGK